MLSSPLYFAAALISASAFANYAPFGAEYRPHLARWRLSAEVPAWLVITVLLVLPMAALWIDCTLLLLRPILGISVFDTLIILLIAYLRRCFALARRPVHAMLRTLDPPLEEMTAALGAG